MNIIQRLKPFVPRKIKSDIRFLLDRKRRSQILEHCYYQKPTVPNIVVPDLIAGEKDVANAARLLKAYTLAMKEYKSPGTDLWTLFTEFQKKFLSLLHEGDPTKLAQYLCNMYKEDATWGTVQGPDEYRRIMGDPKYRNFTALRIKDKLVSLAEAMGALRVENPEQGEIGKSLHLDAGQLAKDISKAVGLDITPPPIDGGLLKIIAGDALFSDRDCHAIYTAHVIRSAGNICEIGGGGGGLAYWSNRFGVSNYTIIDLPRTNVIQAFYLLKSQLDSVSLFGEPEKAIKIIPSNSLPTGKYDLVINQDSFPEIGKETVISYLKWIRSHATKFLSINQEAKAHYPGGQHICVPELIKEVGSFELVQRYPYWLRTGYVMEWYNVKQDGAK